MIDSPELRDRLLAACRAANTTTGEVARALADVLMFSVISAAADVDAAVRDVATVTKAMNAGVRQSFEELHRRTQTLN